MRAERTRNVKAELRNKVANGSQSGIINTIELFRNKDITHRKISTLGSKIIDKTSYNKITEKAIKNGANIRIADEEWLRHLEKNQASAVTIGDTIIFRPDATISDVLEETYHFMQNKNGVNNDKGEPLRTILNEIEAKEYLISDSKKYKIPADEMQLTERQLETYKQQFKAYIKSEGEV